MGTTIRREPVTTSMPAAPDYRFLNITNFGGLEKSSNPFVVESNTASDCLNVYVDEDNALSTRPRLQHQTDFIKDIVDKFPALGLTGAFDLIGVYDLHNGYLIHGVENYIYYMFEYENKNSIHQITGNEIPTEKCTVFEQRDVIYVLDGQKYRNIKNFVISEVKGYVPITKIGKNKRVETTQTDGTVKTEYDLQGSSYESLNLLSDLYKESYFWQGVDDKFVFTDAVDARNEYFKQKDFLATDSSTMIVRAAYPDDTFLLYDWSLNKHYYSILKDTFEIQTIELQQPWSDTYGGPFDYLTSKSVYSRGVLYDIDVDSKSFVVNKSITLSDYFTEKIVESGISPTGKYIWVSYVYQTTSSGVTRIRFGLLDISTDTVTRIDFDEKQIVGFGLSLVELHFANDDQDLLVITTSTESSQESALIFLYTDWKNSNFQNHTHSSYTRYSHYSLYSDASFKKIVLTDRYNDEWIVFYDKNLNDPKKFTMPKQSSITFHEDFVTFTQYNNLSYEIYAILDFSNPLDYYNTHIKLDFNSGGGVVKFINNKYIVSRSGALFLFDDITLPQLYVTRKITNVNTDLFSDWEFLRNFVNKSKLTKRFDNNAWFASNNYTFHTLYNDPTYVPISSYNDLGESFEPITGLSIVNDNILAAYKRNRIYIITPITVGNELTYAYTETKNIIGNDVVDAPTLTILTEMPILVSYNGIYALNQLENVQSSDRITTLISEAMNPKWLKESQTDVDCCLVLNRLYWTYFILPHKKSTNGLIKDNNHTKVYLLDNRTGSWFYWELPIYVISAMVKNNKTHFVTEDGELFTLETTDIINKFNKDLTEYYDDLKKPTLIPWNWTSQILSLNTINYSKRLVDTTFVLTDTDMSDEYALNYKFKAFRKNKNAETTELTLTNDIEYVESITKRTMIPRFNFIQFTLSNTEDDQKLNNNKLRLVGLGLKYVLLGGLY